MRYTARSGMIWAVVLILAVTIAMAEVPQMINYQGRLTDGSGNPLDTIVSIDFTIYDDSTGSGTVWTETHDSVIVIDGLFNVLLGSVSKGAISDTVFNDPDRFLGIKVGGDPELTPRTRMVSVGYAMRANKADSATYAISGPAAGGGWTDDGTEVRLTTRTDNVVIGETTPTTAGTKFEVRGYAGLDTALSRIYFDNTSPWELTYPAFEIYNPTYDYIPFQILGGGVIVQNTPSKKGRGSVIVNEIGVDSSFFNGGPVGIGITSPQNLLHVAGSESVPLLNVDNSGPGRGVRISALGACALWVENSGNHGIRVTNANSDGIHIEHVNNDGIHIQLAENDGIHIENANGWAGYFGGSGYFRDSVGIGIPNPTEALDVDGTIYSRSGGFRFPDGSVQTEAASLDAGAWTDEGTNVRLTTPTDTVKIGSPIDPRGVFKVASDGQCAVHFSASSEWGGQTIIAEFIRDNTNDISDAAAIFGSAVHDTTMGIGGLFTGGKTGVKGVVTPTIIPMGGHVYTGVHGHVDGGWEFNYGVHGYATGFGTNYSIYGQAGSGTGAYYAGYFSGNVDVTGNVSKAGGTFKIDHPLDPENKYLQHSFMESPDMMNVYNGNIVTDKEGLAVVGLPDYFEALNKDFRYQLTVVGQFAQAIIAEKIVDNRFVIRTDKPNVEVSWQVTGIRQDKWAEANRVIVEVDKSDHEKGLYIHPEAYGYDRTKYINHDKERAMQPVKE